MKRNHLHLNALLSINQVLDLETEQDPVGAPGLGEPFCLASMTFPELLIQEGKTMQRPGRSSKDEFRTKRSWEKDLGKDKGEKSLK